MLHAKIHFQINDAIGDQQNKIKNWTGEKLEASNIE